MDAHEKMVDELAQVLWQYESTLVMGRSRYIDWSEENGFIKNRFLGLAKIASAHIAATLATVTPEMVEAWEKAPIPDGIANMTDADANFAVAKSNWTAMLAASPITPKEPKL